MKAHFIVKEWEKILGVSLPNKSSESGGLLCLFWCILEEDQVGKWEADEMFQLEKL